MARRADLIGCNTRSIAKPGGHVLCAGQVSLQLAMASEAEREGLTDAARCTGDQGELAADLHRA